MGSGNAGRVPGAMDDIDLRTPEGRERRRIAVLREDAADFDGIGDAAFEPTREDLEALVALAFRDVDLTETDAMRVWGCDRTEARRRLHGIAARGLRTAADRSEARLGGEDGR